MSKKVIINIPDSTYDKKASLYLPEATPIKAVLLYFHGGALIYGNRDDLPQYHIDSFTTAGIEIISFDYLLAPSATVAEIIDDVCSSINWYLNNRDTIVGTDVPYFLYGRSAGAYLCMMMLNKEFAMKPAGIISYYGYGLISTNWYKTPSEYYLKYPRVPESCLSIPSTSPHGFANIESHFCVYVYLRQTGKWYEYTKTDLTNKNLSLQHYQHNENCCPIFLAHALNDNDVPFSEYYNLCGKFPNSVNYISKANIHDFDSITDSQDTIDVINKTIDFIYHYSENIPSQSLSHSAVE